MWFEKITGFKEESPDSVRENIKVEGKVLTSLVNNRSFQCGTLETPSLEELREQIKTLSINPGKIKVSEMVANVQLLHQNPENSGALFQAASQFNLLEMVNPYITPENGVDIYDRDYTQGPACAIAAGAGTIYRNYFTEVNGQVGQSAENQIDCLKDIGIALSNEELGLWEMKNGYALASQDGLKHITVALTQLDEAAYSSLMGKLRIGIQWDTQITLEGLTHLVSQAYCSALPVAYSQHSAFMWERFARLILEGTYEATLCAALLNYAKTGNNKVYLTLVGGGAFGNRMEWIIDALGYSLKKFQGTPLDVIVVSFGNSNHKVRELTEVFG